MEISFLRTWYLKPGYIDEILFYFFYINYVKLIFKASFNVTSEKNTIGY